MTKRFPSSILTAVAMLALPTGALAEETGGLFGWIHGDWKLIVGATGMVAPDFEGAKDLMFQVSPIVSLGKAGPEARFTSRNDGISISLYDNGLLRAGATGKIIFERDADDELAGLDPVRFGAEIGGFAEIYPTDWLRVRGEVRQGVRSHSGVVADVAVDAFQDIHAVRAGIGRSENILRLRRLFRELLRRERDGIGQIRPVRI